ncbi:hypothetical protein SASPL_108692 [Salvia splendens]|uniref:Retrovirus-related Pol polyprotein from transposon TNT 1-94-like beta-barrel domain-containing protein n=1 Tax=Salvia splendens TaxID=180675 RepID=A0A8X8YCR4_SALSN|nr:hypothetical protein SASPL_108692 [Salvia splendens]
MEDDEEWTNLHEKAHSTIMLCLSDDVIIKVVDQETAATLWTKLEQQVAPEATFVLITHAGRMFDLLFTSERIVNRQRVQQQKIEHRDYLLRKEELALVADEQPYCNDVWILDSGASYHLYPHKEYFTTYELIDGGNVTMANSVVCKVVGIGSVKIRTHDGVFCTLNDVMHVPQMTKNQISLSTFDSKGLSFKGSIVENPTDIASSEVATKDMTKLWHMRLGHMGEHGMRIM